MKIRNNKGLLGSTALASLSLLIGLPVSAQQAPSLQTIAPAQTIRDYFGDNDPADAGFSSDLTDKALIGGMTADGGTFVGSVYRSYSKSIYNGFTWSAGDGVRPVGQRDPNAALDGSQYYTANDISADGSVIVGKASPGVSGGPLGQRAYRWTAGGGFVDLGSLDGNPFSEATAVSGNGQIVVGNSNFGSGSEAGVAAVRWTADGQIEGLGWLPGRDSAESNDTARAASYDGSVIVGDALSASNKFQAFRWTEATGMQALPTLAAYSASQNSAGVGGVSWDGNIIAGYSLQGYQWQAVRWENGQLFSLGGLNGASTALSWSEDISGNGEVIVGRISSGSTAHGFRWTEDDGMLTVEDWLRASGATIQSDLTATAETTNEDGSVVVGLTRSNEVYIARGNGTGPTGTAGSGASSGETGGSTGGSSGSSGTGGSSGSGSGTGSGTGTGGATPGSGTGSNSAGNGAGATAGVITLRSLQTSLGTSAAANTATVNGLGVIVNGAGSRPLDRRTPLGKFTMWAGGDGGRDDHGDRDGTLGLGELGLGYNFGPLQLNGVAGYSALEQNTLNGGKTDVRTGYVKLEALAQITGDAESGLWGVVTGTGLWGNADITRNYVVNGGAIGSSSGKTDVEGYGIRGRLQYENALPHLSPYGEISYAQTCLGGYTEAGGAFPASFNKLCDQSTEFRYGVDARLPINEQLRLVGTVEGVHRFENRGSNVTGQVIGLGGFSLQGSAYQKDWLRAGAGIELDIAGSTLSVMGNATTKGESSSAWLAANWRVTF